MRTETVNPKLGNFIESLRDVGYTFEIAVADVLDNSIAAGAKNVKISALVKPEPSFAILDDGVGMNGLELVEAMRLATRNPNDPRHKDDLGRFGLGLKTASFSQCQNLTVVSLKDGKISARQWDLKLLAKRDEWLLVTPDSADIEMLPLITDLKGQKSGTLVVWRILDRYTSDNFGKEIDRLRSHISLVFHRFIEGVTLKRRLRIEINGAVIEPFNPFNPDHKATQESPEEIIRFNRYKIGVQPFILPHHSKISQQQYEHFATEDGYTRSQGFYLYRANRLLIYGTWFGLHRAVDAHKLVRIRIDIPNNQDRLWGIDIKKSTATPIPHIRKDLKRIIQQVTDRGAKTYSSRGKKISDKNVIRFWQLMTTHSGNARFVLNQDHPLYQELLTVQDDSSFLIAYLRGIEAYLPLETIQAQLQQSPHDLDQRSAFSEDDIEKLTQKLKNSQLPEEFIQQFLITEIYKSREELLLGND